MVWLLAIAFVAFSSIGVIVTYVAGTAVGNYQVYQFFRKKSPKLPVLSKPDLFIGHANKISLASNNWQLNDRLHKKLGKTFGYYYGNQPVVSTTDLDFIKTFVIDEPDSHSDRIRVHIPVREFEYDALMMSEGKQWRRMRKAIAPAFT